MAMVSMNSLLNGKDSRWLQLEVCREFQRNKCSRTDVECKFAHPPANVEVQNGRVTACYDSIKGRCNREKPPCKYFHPPQHLKDQLLINGRNHLALKNALMQQMGLAPGQVLPAQLPTVASNPYLAGVPAVGSGYGPYFAAGPLVPALVGHDPGSAVPSALAPSLPQQVIPASAQKLPRSDRLEMDMKTVGSFYYENFAFPGMVPYKRAAADKSGVPVYQPATTYQQLMQLQQQPFVPVSCEYPAPAPPAAAETRPPSAHAPPPASPPAPSPDPAALAKEVAHSNYAAKLAAAAHHNPPVSVSPVTALSYTGVALNKQASAPPTRAALAAATPPMVYRQPPSVLQQFNPLLRSHLHSQLQSQLQAQQQQLQNQLAQLPQLSQLSQLSQLPSQMGGQMPAHLAAQMAAAQYPSALAGQAGMQWAMPGGGLPPHLMGHVPGLYQQQMLYQMPQQSAPSSSPAVIVNPYKKMKTT